MGGKRMDEGTSGVSDYDGEGGGRDERGRRTYLYQRLLEKGVG